MKLAGAIPGDPNPIVPPLIVRHDPELIDTLPFAVAVTAPKPGIVPFPLIVALAFSELVSITIVIGPDMFTDVAVWA